MDDHNKMENGKMSDEVIRGPLNGRDSQYKMVECTKCKEISECTPFNDFYVPADDPDSHLCTPCHASLLSSMGIGTMVTTEINELGRGKVKPGDRLKLKNESGNPVLLMVSWVRHPKDGHPINLKNMSVIVIVLLIIRFLLW